MSTSYFKIGLLCSFCLIMVNACNNKTDDESPKSGAPSTDPGESLGDLYVSVDAQNASDLNAGTQDSPLQTIQAALVLLAGATEPLSVHVAAGSYHVNYQANTGIHVAENISLIGGYAPDWSNRDAIINITMITDDSVTGGTFAAPNRVIDIDPLATNTSVIDGFEIHAGGGEASVGIFSAGPNDAAIIKGNEIYAGDTNQYSWGIRVGNASVTGNQVYGNNLNVFYGIEGAGLIEENIVQSQATTQFTGIVGNRSSTITGNEILLDILVPPVSTVKGIGIYHNGCCNVTIQNNTVIGTNMQGIYIIYADPYIAAISGNILSNNNNLTCNTTGISLIQSSATIDSNNINCKQGIYGENIGGVSTISNNIIQCGNMNSSYGVYTWVPNNGGALAGTPAVTNNTIMNCQTDLNIL